MVALTDVTNEVNDATLTITGTKDLTGEGKNQVLLSLTTKDSGANSTTNMSTFADEGYTSLVITAYKNGTEDSGGNSVTKPLEETPLFTRTLQDTQLNKAAINLEITHEVTVGSDSKFQAGTSYVFDVRFMGSTLTLLRKVHTFQDAPTLTTTTGGSTVTNYNFVAHVNALGIGLTVDTDANAPKINEVFVEIIKLSDVVGNTEAERVSGRVKVYSLQKYENASGADFASGASAQVIRATGLNTLPNSVDPDNNNNEYTLTSGSSYNMNVIFVTNGGTSDKIRVTQSSNTSTSLLLSSAPNSFKQTFIDQQKTATDVNNNTTQKTLAASILQVLEITALSGSEILDKISTQIGIGSTNRTFASDSNYASSAANASKFEGDFVQTLTQNEGGTDLTKKFIAVRYTLASNASSTSLTGTQLSQLSGGSANYPTKVSGDAGFQDRTVAQVCTETVTFFNTKQMGLSDTADNTFGTSTGADHTIKVIYVQVTDLDFATLVDDVQTVISNSSATVDSSTVTTFVHRTDVSGTLTETGPSGTTSFTTIKMDLPSGNGTSFADNTLQITQNELNAAGNQSFEIQCQSNLLSTFISDSIIDFVQITLDDNSDTGDTRFKSFTVDSNTSPTAIDFLKNSATLTLTNGTAFGATADTTKANAFGVLPESSNSLPAASAGYKPYSTRQSIAFDAASIVENLHVVAHMKGYNYGTQLFSGNMSLRYEQPSLVQGGTIVNYADVNGDGSTTVSIYGVSGQYEGNVRGVGKISEGAWNNNITAETAGKTSLYAGSPRSKPAFVAMSRIPLTPTVRAEQTSKAVLPNSGVGAAFTLTITEQLEHQEWKFPNPAGGNYASGDLAPYDLTVAGNRPSTVTIKLRERGLGSATDIIADTPLTQTFIIDLTGSQTTSQGNTNFTTTAASGTTAGVYSVILENGRTLGLDESSSAATVTFSPGDLLEVTLALGNATYGTSPLTYILPVTGSNKEYNGSYGPAGSDISTANGYYLSRFDTVTGAYGNGGDDLPLFTTKYLNSTSASALIYDFNGVPGGNAVGYDYMDVFGVNTNRSAGPIVGAPTVSFGPENQGNNTGATGRFIFNVVANTSDIDQLIDYTKLEVNFTVGSTTTTHTFGTFGTALADGGGLTVNGKGDYKVTFNSGTGIGGATATFVGGDTVSATAKLMTDYDRTGAVSASTGTKTIRTNATFKTAAGGDAYLTADKALFDVDLIDKNTLRLAAYYLNHGVTTVDTLDDLITLNGNNGSNIILKVIAQYESTQNNFANLPSNVVNTLHDSTAGNSFASLATSDVITLDLGTDNVQILKNRLVSGANNEGVVRLRLAFELTTIYADTNNVNNLHPIPFTPYLEKLSLDSVEAVSAVGDTLTWDVKFTPEAYKTNLKSVKMALGIQKNNIGSHTLALHNATANNNAIKIVDVTTSRTTTGTSLDSYTSSNDPTDGAEATVRFKTNATAATRGSYLVPKFTVNSTASNDSHNTSKDFTAYENAQTHNVADSDFTTRAGQKLAARAGGQVNPDPISSNSRSSFSMIPNGNTSGVILAVDNDSTGGKELALGHISGQTNQTNAIGELVNNNPFNAVFGTTVTLTLGTGTVNAGDTTDRVFQVAGLYNLTITPGTTTVANVLAALNNIAIFPSTMLLPGAAGEAATVAWSLSNTEFNNGSGSLSNTSDTLNNIATIKLQFEGSVSATSKVSYVAVTHVSGGTGTGVSIATTNDFMVLSLTNAATTAQPLPTLVVADDGTTGAYTDLIIAQSSISNTTNGNTTSVSGLVTTADVTLAD